MTEVLTGIFISRVEYEVSEHKQFMYVSVSSLADWVQRGEV